MEKAKAKDHDSYGAYTIIAVLFPLIGFILSIVHIAKSDRVDKKLGEHLLATSILCSLVWAVLFFAFLGSVASHVADNLEKSTADTAKQPATQEAVKAAPTHVGGTLFAENVSVKLTQVIDPAQSDSAYLKADAGKRYVAIKLELLNKGSAAEDDNANNSTTIIGSDNQTYTASFVDITGCTNFGHGSYKLAPGGSATGCVNFEMPNGVSPAKVHFSPHSGFSEVTDEWLVP